MRLIAIWNQSQNAMTDDPIRLEWENGTVATMEDFARIETHTQSAAYLYDGEVEFSYEVTPRRAKIEDNPADRLFNPPWIDR